jgi:glyoxylase-like metal-dependent hydrolase (beta-lactamase superfamily II)
MDQSLNLLVHGRGNAWPVPLGENHPFYNRSDYRDLANAAFSLVATDREKVTADILVDAGHGTIQSLVSGSNRIPHCICLTHGHMDHTLSVDWVVQSYWRLHRKESRYPVYATRQVFSFLIGSYPHLQELVEFRELIPGEKVSLGLQEEVNLTCFPVYHGKGAPGASMLLFETGGKRVLFTGDLLSPLLRRADYERLQGADMVVADCNNRYPWPRTNHWSFAGHPDHPMERSEPLTSFLMEMDHSQFTGPHGPGEPGEGGSPFFEKLEAEWDQATQPFTVLEFLNRIGARNAMLVHYSGAEDRKYYGKPMLTAGQMVHWVKETALKAGSGSKFIIPEPGEKVPL